MEMSQLYKPMKPKKCIAMFDCLKKSVSSDKEVIKAIYLNCIAAMKKQNPDFSYEPLDEDKVLIDNRANPIQTTDQAVQVCMDETTENQTAANSNVNGKDPMIVSGHPRQYVIDETHHALMKVQHKVQKNKKRKITKEGSVVIKIEDSSSEDSNLSDERNITEMIVHKMVKPCVPPSNSISSKALLHYVVLENLPLHVTAEDLIGELFQSLLGINPEEVTGITVHAEKTESIAQIYFKDIKHVQKLLVFSGKLVFKGRVMVSKIGTS